MVPETQNATIRGGIKKNKLFLFQKKSERGAGGLAQSKISLSEKNEIFLDFFSKGGVVSPIPKVCYHKKKWGFLDIFSKRGGLTQSKGIL